MKIKKRNGRPFLLNKASPTNGMHEQIIIHCLLFEMHIFIVFDHQIGSSHLDEFFFVDFIPEK